MQQLAGRVLLFNLGEQGLKELRVAALNDNIIALAMVCHLGHEAGKEVRQHARALVLTSPSSKRMMNIHQWCQRAIPTRFGMFANDQL